jgi:Mitochondrial ribosomal protein (VAR1)
MNKKIAQNKDFRGIYNIANINANDISPFCSIKNGFFDIKNLLAMRASVGTLEKNYNSNEPFIFNKKVSKIKTIRYIDNDSGKMRHFTPAAQEWVNSIYSYNENYTKLLPVADTKLRSLLKSYFNILIYQNFLKINRIPNRYRKLSTKKVFVGKGELKHTSGKVIITSYVYNAEQLYLKSLVKKHGRYLYYPKEQLIKYINIDTDGKEIITYNRPFTLEEYLNLPDHSIWHKNYCFTLFVKQYIKLIGKNKLSNVVKKENKLIDEEKKKDIKFLDKIKVIFSETFTQYIYNETTFKRLFSPILNLVEKENEKKLLKFEIQVIKNKLFFDNFEKYMVLAEDNYKKNLKKYIYLLMISNVKFEKPFISKLTGLVKSIYNKEVEFNLVNLYRMHLNSDIYTQGIALKLKNRDNKLFTVLTRSLSKVKLPNISRIQEKFHQEDWNEYLINKIRNAYIKSMFKENITEDSLNNLLLNYFPSTNDLKINIKKRWSIIKRPVSLYKYIINTLKHGWLAGVRVEAKGRLTRRFTADRSVFKVKWKGGLKNVDSSFKGLSTIMLRGDQKSNVQYSMLSSKNRNGAFGVKGWVSSK